MRLWRHFSQMNHVCKRHGSDCTIFSVAFPVTVQAVFYHLSREKWKNTETIEHDQKLIEMLFPITLISHHPFVYMLTAPHNPQPSITGPTAYFPSVSISNKLNFPDVMWLKTPQTPVTGVGLQRTLAPVEPVHPDWFGGGPC